MQAACDGSDWTQLAELAHWLKGAGGTVGFDCFTEPARRLEQAARTANASEAKNLLEQLHRLAEKIAVPSPSI